MNKANLQELPKLFLRAKTGCTCTIHSVQRRTVRHFKEVRLKALSVYSINIILGKKRFTIIFFLLPSLLLSDGFKGRFCGKVG